MTNKLREMRIYRKISSGEWPYEAAQPVTEWDRKRLDVLVNFLDFDIVYPLLLAATQLKQKTFAELVHMLEKFMFRYKSVCNLGHQKLSDLYMQEAVKIRNDPTAYSLGGLKTVLKRFMTTECTNEVFTAGLSNMRYRTTGSNKQLRYFFSTLNEYIEWYRDGANGKPQANTSIVINNEKKSLISGYNSAIAFCRMLESVDPSVTISIFLPSPKDLTISFFVVQPASTKSA